MDPDSHSPMPSEDDSDAPVRLDESGHQTGQETGSANGRGHANGHLPDGMNANGDVRAGNVTLHQGGARDINATTVTLTQGGAAQVHAEQLSISQGGVAVARATNLTINEGGSAFAVVSDRATINEGGNVLVLVAGEVSGDARPLLDWRAALALAAGLVLAWRVARRIL